MAASSAESAICSVSKVFKGGRRFHVIVGSCGSIIYTILEVAQLLFLLQMKHAEHGEGDVDAHVVDLQEQQGPERSRLTKATYRWYPNRRLRV